MLQQRRRQEEDANAARMAALRREQENKVKMKGKNKPSRRHRKKQSNIIEDRKPTIKERQKEEVRANASACTAVSAGLGPVACTAAVLHALVLWYYVFIDPAGDTAQGGGAEEGGQRHSRECAQGGAPLLQGVACRIGCACCKVLIALVTQAELIVKCGYVAMMQRNLVDSRHRSMRRGSEGGVGLSTLRVRASAFVAPRQESAHKPRRGCCNILLM